jgi:hypothetical protein
MTQQDQISLDGRVYLALGQAVARAQEVEVVMVRLLEQQRQDTSLPLDDRWEEISGWLDLTAGQLRRRLGVPDALARDLVAAVGRRNRVAHDAWMLYSVATNRQESADTWVPWLQGEAMMLMGVRRGLAAMSDQAREARANGRQITDDEAIQLWREYVPEPVEPRPDRSST